MNWLQQLTLRRFMLVVFGYLAFGFLIHSFRGELYLSVAVETPVFDPCSPSSEDYEEAAGTPAAESAPAPAPPEESEQSANTLKAVPDPAFTQQASATDDKQTKDENPATTDKPAAQPAVTPGMNLVSQKEPYVRVTGRVYRNGQHVPNVTVVAIPSRKPSDCSPVTSVLVYGDSVIVGKTNDTGDFEIIIPLTAATSGSGATSEIQSLRVVAITDRSFFDPFRVETAKIVCLKCSQVVSPATVTSYVYAVILVVAFLLGMVLAVLPISAWSFEWILRTKVTYRAKWKYVCSLVTTVVIVMCIIVQIALFHMHANAAHTSGTNDIRYDKRVFNLGFANVYYGSYVSDQPEQLLLSLTEPESPKTSAACANGCSPAPKPLPVVPTKGLGAPLWVILLGSIGALAFTIRVVISEFESPPAYLDKAYCLEHGPTDGVSVWDDATDGPDLRRRCRRFIELQFFALFSPLASMIVYQTLIAAEAANNVVAVAIIMLASSLAVPAILQSAQRTMESFIAGNNQLNGPSAVPPPANDARLNHDEPPVDTAHPEQPVNDDDRNAENEGAV